MAHIHSVYDSDTHFSINPITRALKNESPSKTTLVQGDHNSERFTFDIPKIIEGHDMSLCNKVEVHFINIDAKTKEEKTGLYEVDDLGISPNGDDVVICSWLIKRDATQLVGPLGFLLCFKCETDGIIDYAWHTATCNGISVTSGINADETFADDYCDVIEKWKDSVVRDFEAELRLVADEMKDEVSAWEEAATNNVRAEMTEFSNGWNATLDVERVRIDELAAVRTTGNVGVYEIDGQYVRGAIKSNGFFAEIAFTATDLHDMPGDGDISSTDYCIPAAFMPMSWVDLVATRDNGGCEAFIDPEDVDENGMLRITFTHVTDVMPDTVSFSAGYNLANVTIPELTDIRVDAEGNIHESAGTAVRVGVDHTKEYVDEQADEVMDFVKKVLADDLTKYATVKGGYIRQDKVYVSSGTHWESFVVPVSKIAVITKATLWTNATTFYGVSFYSAEDITADNFISGLTFGGPGGTYAVDFTDITIPEDAVIAVFVNRKTSGTATVEGITRDITNAVLYTPQNLTDEQKAQARDNIGAAKYVPIPTVDTELDPTSHNPVANSAVAREVALLNERLSNLESDEPEVVVETLTLDDATEVKKGYIVEDGSFTVHPTNWLAYVFNVSDLDVFSVSASVYSDADIWNVIAFYSDTEISADNFISGKKRPSTVNHPTFTDVSVPEGTKLIVISNRIASGTDETAELKYRATVNPDVPTTIESTFGKGNIKAIYRDVPCNNDFTVVGDEIWFSQEYGTPLVCHVHRYKIEDGKLVEIAKNMNTDFGHWNTLDYCAENDCLVFGNGGNDSTDLDTTTGNFFSVIPNPRALGMTATLADCSIKYPVGVGFGKKVQAVWGDSNLGKNNIVYVFANASKKIVKVMLKQNEDGSFYKNPETGEGEYKVLEEVEQPTSIGVGGGDFWGDTLYIGNGGNYGLAMMSMTDYSVKLMQKHYYRDYDTEFSGCTQGVHVDSDYLWVLSNVSASMAENGFETYLVQYYR